MPYCSTCITDSTGKLSAINPKRFRRLVITTSADIDQPEGFRLVNWEIGSRLSDDCHGR